jgi:hypothetical protein
MILPLEDANRVDKNIYLFTIPPTCITEIVLGCNIQQSDKDEIIYILKNDNDLSHVKIKEATLNYDEYSLTISELQL